MKRRVPWVEIALVLGLSLGRSGVYAIVALLDRLTQNTALRDQTASLNPQLADRAWLDVTYQALGIGFSLLPVVLALHLLGGAGHADRPVRDGARAVGLGAVLGRGRTALHGLGLAAAVGLPGLGLYALARAMGAAVSVQTTPQEIAWWTVPVLVLAALRNGLLEEVVAVGYLTERLDAAGVRPAASLTASALLRGSYHLYQGPAMALGNVAMGVLYGAYYRRTRSTLPLVVAHTLIDVVAFVGPVLVSAELLARLGLT